MKESTKQRRHDEKLAELLGLSLEEVQASREQEERDDKVLEAQSVLLFLEHPEAFMEKRCDECGEYFLTTYKFVSNCSSPCRSKSLDRIGISWNPMHNQVERWQRAKIPTGYTIPPTALQILLAIAQEQQAQVDCETDEPNESTQYIEQSKNELQTNPVEQLPELDLIVVPDFSL